MPCKLHLPTEYDPQLDAVYCRCGVLVITAVESADSGRWRWCFQHHPQQILRLK